MSSQSDLADLIGDARHGADVRDRFDSWWQTQQRGTAVLFAEGWLDDLAGENAPLPPTLVLLRNHMAARVAARRERDGTPAGPRDPSPAERGRPDSFMEIVNNARIGRDARYEFDSWARAIGPKRAADRVRAYLPGAGPSQAPLLIELWDHLRRRLPELDAAGAQPFASRAAALPEAAIPGTRRDIEELLTRAEQALDEGAGGETRLRAIELWRNTLRDHLYSDAPDPLVLEKAGSMLAGLLAPERPALARFGDALVDAGMTAGEAAATVESMGRIVDALPRLGGPDPVEAATVASEVLAETEELGEHLDTLPAVQVTVPATTGDAGGRVSAKLARAVKAVTLASSAAAGVAKLIEVMPAIIRFLEASWAWFVRMLP